MSQIPANKRLWDLTVTQARIKFHPYPSIAASAWVHKTYTQRGGRFVESEKQVDPRQKAYARAKKAAEKKHKG